MLGLGYPDARPLYPLVEKKTGTLINNAGLRLRESKWTTVEKHLSCTRIQRLFGPSSTPPFLSERNRAAAYLAPTLPDWSYQNC
jgi:hypothetical protein